MAILFCGEMGCGRELRCVEVGVWVRDGVFVRAGDVYSCPTCHRDTVVGAERLVAPLDNERLFERVSAALDATGAPYVRHQYVVDFH